MKFGNRRIVVVNSYDAAKVLWVDNMASTCSRPVSYTFHKVVSSSQGLTIGTTPWSKTYKRMKKVTASALNKPSIKAYMGIIDYESTFCFKNIQTELQKSASKSIDVRRFFNSYSLNTSLTLNYGTRLDCLGEGLLDEIMFVEKEVGKFRGTFSSNLQDYLPFLKYVPSFMNSYNQFAIEIRQRRDNYMNTLLENLRQEISQGIDIPCITGDILKMQANAEGAADAIDLCENELKSICLTMVSAGLDTIPAIIIFFIGHMSQDYGQKIQKKAYEEITTAFKNSPWQECLYSDSTLPYVNALVKESLRFSGMPLSLPRKLVRDVHYNDALIPEGTTLILNSFAANFDELHFFDPYRFNPERYCKSTTTSTSLSSAGTGPAHFSFGAGMRMCCGSILAEKEIYIAIIRLIYLFEILPPSNVEDQMPSDPFELYKEQESLMITTPPFKVRLIPRNEEILSKWISSSLDYSIVNSEREKMVV